MEVSYEPKSKKKETGIFNSIKMYEYLSAEFRQETKTANKEKSIPQKEIRSVKI